MWSHLEYLVSLKKLELPEKEPLLNSKTPLRRAGRHTREYGDQHIMKYLVIHTDAHTPPQEPGEKINYQNSRGRETALGRGAPKVDVL